VIEQIALLAVDQGQQVPVQVAFGLRCRVIGDPVNLEPFTRPLARVSIADDAVIP